MNQRVNEARAAELAWRKEEIERLVRWVHDLQSEMYINCVYCGHRYGPEDEVPATMADALKEHIEACSKHPMSLLKHQWERAIEAARYVFANTNQYDPIQVIDYIVAEKNAIVRAPARPPKGATDEHDGTAGKTTNRH